MLIGWLCTTAELYEAYSQCSVSLVTEGPPEPTGHASVKSFTVLGAMSMQSKALSVHFFHRRLTTNVPTVSMQAAVKDIQAKRAASAKPAAEAKA
eukprot:2098-Pelagomonas_calceolata.AAC.1